ncbi:Organic hydroperoxide resistance protein OhrA [Dyadobacter sp. CECT 9623]|jgi:osmotically inducible protein OsmC|uniref:Organic hydroperoxide resistance protein OhrA n=1 Tax=Dyadobacter linearis TaxID=2823330 RepID=A0ABN7R8R1_9BACT|nr:organic hydroperoxide resistance protein [Dyadobacter sp. CECT 9623]CAG5068579.1 Organic hydroperoxide resistance protein OhrA [Dyadobacter sp. CECT 9623]
MKIEPVYTAKATATGGRNGKVKSENGVLDIDVRVPKEMGGPSGEYLNPEMLFAGGYAACFDSALSLIMRQEKITGVTTSVTAAVSIGKIENGGFGLSVVLEIEAPGLEKEQTEELVKKAHQVCPYSNATRGNVEVELIVK